MTKVLALRSTGISFGLKPKATSRIGKVARYSLDKFARQKISDHLSMWIRSIGDSNVTRLRKICLRGICRMRAGLYLDVAFNIPALPSAFSLHCGVTYSGAMDPGSLGSR